MVRLSKRRAHCRKAGAVGSAAALGKQTGPRAVLGFTAEYHASITTDSAERARTETTPFPATEAPRARKAPPRTPKTPYKPPQYKYYGPTPESAAAKRAKQCEKAKDEADDIVIAREAGAKHMIGERKVPIKYVTQPARSPDLNVLDLGAWRSLQTVVEEVKYAAGDDLDGLSDAEVKEKHGSIETRLVAECVKAWEEAWMASNRLGSLFNYLPYVLQAIVDAEGGNSFKMPHRPAHVAQTWRIDTPYALIDSKRADVQTDDDDDFDEDDDASDVDDEPVFDYDEDTCIKTPIGVIIRCIDIDDVQTLGKDGYKSNEAVDADDTEYVPTAPSAKRAQASSARAAPTSGRSQRKRKPPPKLQESAMADDDDDDDDDERASTASARKRQRVAKK